MSAIDPGDPDWIAQIRPVREVVNRVPAGLTADTSDEWIETFAAAIEDQLRSEGIAVDGSIVEVLKAMREELRQAEMSLP